MADVFDNKTGALKPDGKDDSLASEQAKGIAEDYIRQRDDAAAVSEDAGTSAAGDDVLALVDSVLGSFSGLVADTDKKKFDISLTTPFEGYDPDIPTFLSPNAAEIEKGGFRADYYELQSGGFLQLDNQTIRDKVFEAAKKDPEKVEAIYQQALLRTAMLNQAGKDISVEEVLNGFIKDGVPGSGAGGGPFSTTNRSVSLTNEGTARTVLQAALTGYLGRSATTQENKAFLNALNVQEKANPTTTVTKGNTSGRVTDQESTTTGGFDRNDFADRFAKSQEGYAEYQTATTYLDAFIEGLEDQTRVIG